MVSDAAKKKAAAKKAAAGSKRSSKRATQDEEPRPSEATIVGAHTEFVSRACSSNKRFAACQSVQAECPGQSAEALIVWHQTQAPACTAVVLPPSLTPRQRAAVHQAAEEAGIPHESIGEGGERRLAVGGNRQPTP